MGVVWEAWDERLQRPVAVKQLHTQAGLSASEAELASKRAMREARITARLHHPHAVTVYDVVEHDNNPCLIMQYLPSTNLQAVMAQRHYLAPTEVARIGAELASALAAAHQVGIVHRDVKPGNVLIAEDGAAKLTDFGVSHALGDVTLTSTGMVTGTPAYLAPEVARGADSNFASDVFSLGSTLYAATEGTPPFGTDQNPMAVLHKVASGQFLPPRRSGPLTPLLLRMLAADPADRPPMIDVEHTLAALHRDTADVATAQLTRQNRPARAPDPAAAATTAAMPVRPSPPADRRRTGAGAAVAGAAVGSTAFAGPASGRTAGGDDTGRRRRPVGGFLALGAAVLIGAAILVGVLLVGHGNGGHGAPSPGASGPSATNLGAPATGSGLSASRLASSTPSHTAQTTPPPPTSKAATSSPATQPAVPTADQLARAVSDYYGLLPGNTDAGWARLTPQYQAGHSGGRQGYENFWGAIQRVSVSKTSATPPGNVEATITYTYKDGRVVEERTSYQLVSDAGVLKINDSSVLDSKSRGKSK